MQDRILQKSGIVNTFNKNIFLSMAFAFSAIASQNGPFYSGIGAHESNHELTDAENRIISNRIKGYKPKPARKGAFKKKLSKKQRKQLKS